MKGVRGALRERPDDLPLHRGDRACAVVELETVPRVKEPGAERPGERRGEQHPRRGAVDLVQHDLVVEHDDAGQLHVQDAVRPDFRRAEGLIARLGDGVNARPDHLADMPAEQPRGVRGRDELVGAPRVGHPASGHRDPVLAEVLPVEAADLCRRAVQVRGKDRGARPAQRERIDVVGGGLHALNARQPAQLPGQVRRAHRQAHVRGVRAGEERGERGLGAPRRGDRAHRDPAGEPDQQHDREVAAPPAAERGREPVPRDPHDLSHGTVTPRSDSAVRAAQAPHMPCTPPPGGVEAEHR